MAQFVNMFEVDLQKPNHPQPLRAIVGEGDSNGMKVGAYVTDGGTAVSLGGSCVGKVVRADGATVQLTGTISGNSAYVVLDQQSCAIEGQIQVAVCWVNISNVTTLVLAYGTVVNTQTGTAIQPSTPIPDLTQLLAEISAMETATAAANAAASSALTNFAGAFSSSTAYTAGQYVTYTDGKFYRFTTNHAAGAWNSAHVVAVTTGNELADLKSATKKIEDATITKTSSTQTTDITSSLTFTSGYMNTAGEIGASSSYLYSNKFGVKQGDVIQSGSASYNLRYITAFNGDTVISAKGSDATAAYTVPSGVNYVVVTIYSAVGTTSNAVLHTETIVTYENILGDTVDALTDDVDAIESVTIVKKEESITTDLTSTLTFTNGYIDKNGDVGSSTSYKYSNHIPVAEGNIIFTNNATYALRYITAYDGVSAVSSKSANDVLTYTVPSGVDSVVVTVYTATGLAAGTVNKSVLANVPHNIYEETINDIKYNTIYYKEVARDISSLLRFTAGYVNKSGEIVNGSTTYHYSNKISVHEGDVFTTSEYPFRYVTAYNGMAVAEKSAETVLTYTVPSGVSELILTTYIATTGGIIKTAEDGYSLFYGSLAQKNVGYFEKPYICLSCDDGADELATYTIPMIIAKGVPCTFGLYKTSPVFQHGYTNNVMNAVNNYNCEIAQHGGQHSWTDFSVEELVAFFDDEEQFWQGLGITVKSAIYPTHLSNPMVRAITGSRFGCCRSGYDYDGILFYTDDSRPSGSLPYYGTGARSNLFAMSSWNMPAGKDLPFAKACVDWAIANNKLIHWYWHDWDLDSTSKSVLESAIDYAKTQNITFIKLSDVVNIK